jgi:all-beta uncharacterized protein
MKLPEIEHVLQQLGDLALAHSALPVPQPGPRLLGAMLLDFHASSARTNKLITRIVYSVIAALVAFGLVQVVEAAGNIDPVNKWAWGTNAGWINFNPSNGGVSVCADHLEGYAWAENIGWIKLGTFSGCAAHTYNNTSTTDYGVNKDSSGNLSGNAWSTNAGWIKFNPTNGGVTINSTTGSFDGYAWAENVGWIHFKGTGAVPYNVVVTVTCTYSLFPTSQSVTASATTGTLSVTSPSGCTWTSSSNVDWITITSGRSGSGNGTVVYAVAANPHSSSRIGTLTIAGQTFTVTQGPALSLSLSASVNQQTFTVGQSLSAGGAVIDPGLPVAADFYVGILRPDGSIQFFTNAGIVLGNVANVTSFRPLAVAVPLGTPFSVNAPNFYTHQWTAGDLHGGYVFFVGAVTTGALAGGTVPSDQILGLATASFSFP